MNQVELVQTAAAARAGSDSVPEAEAAPCEVVGDDTSVTSVAPPVETTRASPRPEVPSVVLIIDPDPVSRRFAELAIGRKSGLRVEQAVDGAGAIEILTTKRIHLVLSETEFADMSGLQLLQRFTQAERSQGVPFVFLSADGRPAAKSAAFTAGAAEFLVKPCDGEVLSIRVRTLIDRERRTTALRCGSSYGLAGRLSELCGADLLALLEHGQRSGTVSVACDDATGSLFIQGGHVVHAVFGSLVGGRAEAELLALTEGHFEFTPGICPIAPERWTVRRTPGGGGIDTRNVTAKYFAVTPDAPAVVVVDEPRLAEIVAWSAPPVADAAPAFVPDPGSAAQIEDAIRDGFALGDLMSFTEQDLASWTATSPIRDRFHVLLCADLPQGVSAMLSLAGSPTEQWVLRGLSAQLAAVGLSFFLRRARQLDVVLLDIRAPARLLESLRRVPSVVIVAPPAGDPVAMGVKARIEIVDLVARLQPPAVLILGNPSFKRAFRVPGAETAIRCLPAALGDPGADLRAVLAEAIRLCAGPPR